MIVQVIQDSKNGLRILWGYVCSFLFVDFRKNIIENDWKLQRLLNICIMTSSREKVYNLLANYNIENKFLSFTMENTTANDELC